MKYFATLLLVGGLGLLAYQYYSGHPKPAPAPSVTPAAPTPAAPVPQFQPPAPIMDENSLEKVRSATTDSDPHVRWEAAQLLSNTHDPQAEDILVRLLRSDDDAAIRRNAIDLLAKQDAKKALPHILFALRDIEADVRLAALAALGRLGDYSASQAISDVLRDVDERVRLAALHTLNELQAKHAQEAQKIEQERKRYNEEAAKRKTTPQTR